MKKQLFFAFSFIIALPAISAQPQQANSVEYQQAVQLKQKNKFAEAEKEFISIIQREPNNMLAFEQLAIVQSWQNKLSEAIENFKRALSIDAYYTSARVGLARVLYWQGERTVALAEIERAIQEQPDVSGHWILKGDILMADDQPNQAHKAYLQAQVSLKGNTTPELEKKISQAKEPKNWRLDVGYISDKFNQRLTDGYNSYLQIGYALNKNTTLYARSEGYLHFDNRDSGVVLGGYYAPHKTVLLNAEYYRNNNDARSRPSQQASINADFLLNDSWQPLLGYRHANYHIVGSEGSVNTITPGIRFNYTNSTLEFRHARSHNINDTSTSTNTLKLNLTYDKIAPYIVYTNGEEGIPPLSIAKISVLGVGAVFSINDSISARIDYNFENRKETYKKQSLGAGISVFF